MNQRVKSITLALAVVAIIGTIWYLESHKPAQLNSSSADIVISPNTSTSSSVADRSAILKQKAAQYPRAKELSDIQGYINTNTFKLVDLVGKKVILLDFWTYSCINCLRTIPHLNEWYQKYKDQGFVIVGVHSPEFSFEKDYANVAKAVTDAGIQYPVVLDSNMGTWKAYGNQYWPREYLIDIDGYVVHDHIGEGNYDETEKIIQNLVMERARVLGENMPAAQSITSPHQDDIQTASPETYFGSTRNQYLGNGRAGVSGEQTFTQPPNVVPNTLYLAGPWNIHDEYAETVGSAAIGYRYQAKRLYFVAGGSGGKSMDIEVLRDGKSLDASVKGADIFFRDGKSYVTISGNRLYKIIEDSQAGGHTVEFVIPESGLQAFTFTFG